MSSFASEPHPLDIDDVQHLREAAGEIRLRVSGRWRGESPPSGADSALLVIQIEGRRHRFAPVADADTSTPATAGRWTASFVVPGWAEPRREGQAALWIGEAVVPIPPIGASRRWPGSGPPALGSAVPADLPDVPHPSAATPPALAAAPPPARDWVPVEPSPEPGRSGPLADMLLKETVAALHGELEARAAETTRLRSALAGAQSELEARGDSQTELEGTLGELGAELRRLMEAVEEQRRELDRRDTEGAREREEFERRLAELSVARDDQAAELVAVREELASAREELAGARDRYGAELASAGETHAAELAALREQHASSTGAEREQAAAEQRELHAQLAAAQESARRRAGEIAGLREELAAAQVAREGARSEVDGLRAELERLGGELAVTREHIDSQTGDLGEANRLLADARALAEQLRARPASG
jgi:DNA repair exonuclease SbcCD ATPase subunit